MATIIYSIGSTTSEVFPDSQLKYNIDQVLATGEIGQLGNVDLTGTTPALATDHFMVYNGTSWVHKQPSDALISLGLTANAAELNKLDGVVVSTAQINYLDIGTLGEAFPGKVLTTSTDGDLTVFDSDKFQFGEGLDMTLYHDGTDSYITNQTGALKIATETEGIAVHIGHATSEVTIGDNLVVSGNLTVNGSTTSISSTVTTIQDPIMTLGGSQDLTLDDNKDRGIEFRWHDGTNPKLGFFGWDDSASKFTFISDATNTSEVFSGSAGDVAFGGAEFSNHVQVKDGKSLRLSELDSNGANHISIKAPDSVSSDITLTLPDGTGTDGQVLTSGGPGGLLRWETVAGGGGSSVFAEHAVTVGGSSAPASDDGQDKGLLFRWHDGASAKLGFLGFDRSSSTFSMIPDATVNAGVISGNLGNAKFNIGEFVRNQVTDYVSLLGGARIFFQADNNTNTIELKAPTTVTTSTTLILPDGDGTNGQYLQTDGSGNLSWSSVSSGSSTLASLTDTSVSSPSAGHILVHDGVDSFDNVAISGDATLASDGALTISAAAVQGSMLNADVISSQTELAAGLDAADELMVSDAGVLKRMDVSVLQAFMQSNLTFTTLTQEDVEDYVGAMVSGNTETFIDVTYDDADGTLDFVVPVLDEDNMASDSAAHLATQQSIKAYVDSQVSGAGLDIDGYSTTATSLGQADLLVASVGGTEQKVSFSDLEDSVFASISGDATVAAGGALTISAGAVEGSMLNADVISSQAELAAGLEATDELMVSDAGVLKRADVSVLQSFMQSNLTFTTNTDVDVSKANLKTKLSQLTQTADGNLTIGDNTDPSSVVIKGNLTVEGTTTTVDSTVINVNNSIVFEGATADEFETTLTVVDPTSDHTISLPNQSGHIPLLDVASTTLITSSPADLNLLDGSVADTVVNSKAVIYSSAGNISATTYTGAWAGDVIADAYVADALTINGGTINGSVIGGTTPAAGSFTTLTASSSLSGASLQLTGGVSATTILDEDGLTSDSATALATQQSIKAYVDSQITGAGLDIDAYGTTATSLGQNDLLVVSVSGAEQKVSFSDLEDSVFASVSGDATIAAAGALTLANTAVTAGSYGSSTSIPVLTVDSKGRLTAASTSTLEILGDTTPQLGGDLDVNSNEIVSTSNGNISLTPNGTGVVRIDGTSGVDIQSGEISVKNSGSVSNVKLYCEVGNAHYTQLQSAAHADYSGNVILTLPTSTGNLVGTGDTGTVTDTMLAGSISASKLTGAIFEDLETLGAASSDGEFIVATGAGAFAYESGDTARTSLGLGTGDSPTFTSLTLSGQTASLSMNSQKIVSLATPTADSDAATKSYVDSVAQGLSAKDSVRVATTASQTLSTDFANGQSIDGVTLATGDRVLIKDQTAGAENGIYVVAASGAPTRSVDFDSNAEVAKGAFVFVEEGTSNGDAGFVLTTDGAITLGTTSLAFTQFSGAGQVSAGEGLTKTGSVLDVSLNEFTSDSGIDLTADSLVYVDASASNGNKKLTGQELQNSLATAMAGDGITATSGVLTAARLTTNDQSATASATSSDGDTTGITISATPSAMVQVFVNGLLHELGQGVKTKDCYFSADGGTTARAISAIASGDTLYWNGSVAEYQLDANDKITLIYETE